MRIVELQITKYGPLEKRNLEFRPDINIVFGSNESGKSLTMDFLLKKLAKKRIAKYKRIDRVEEEPEGYLVIQNNSEVRKLERREFLTDLLEIVKDEDICKIFVMKDSDFNIPDNEYYVNITDRLTGLRTKDIEGITKEILNFGCLTSTSRELANTIKSNKIKTKINNAETLRNDISKYLTDFEDSDLSKIEGDIFIKKLNLKQKEIELEKQQKAKIKDDFDKNKEAINEIQKAEEKIEKLPEENELKKILTNIDTFKSKKSDIFERIIQFSRWGLIPSFLLFLAFWIVWLITNQPIIGIISPIAVSVLLVIFTSIWGFAFNKKRKHDIIGKETLSNAEKLGVKSESIEELLKLTNATLKKIEENNKTIQQNVGALIRSLNLEDKSDLVVKKAEAKLLEHEGNIDHNFKVKYNEKKLQKLEGEISILKEDISNLVGKLNQHKIELGDFSKRISRLDINSVLLDDINIEIENIETLIVAKERINCFIDFIKNRTVVCRNALEIIDKIQIEEKDKINQLFDEDSVSINFFKDITNGRYISIRFDSEKNSIFVKKANEKEISADKLSEGTYDQLYLAIRVDLAQRILDNDVGFLIMDDIFLSYDKDRLLEGIRVLKKLSDLGWQIIYFTAKDEIRDAFTEISDYKLLELKLVQ